MMKKHLFLIILSIINISVFAGCFWFSYLVASDFLFLAIHNEGAKLSLGLFLLGVYPSFMYISMIKFVKHRKVARRIFKGLIIALSVFIFFIQCVSAMVSPGPFMSQTNEIENFGKYDDTIANELKSDNIEPIF